MYPGTHVQTTPDKPAVIMAGSGRTVTYAELDDESTRLAQAFRAAGLGTGDAIAILMDNAARFLTVCWAAQRSGLRYVPVNWHLTLDEMRYILDDCGASALVANLACAETAAALRDAEAVRCAIAVECAIDGFDDFDEVVAAQAGGPLADETEGSDMIYTSGTTGRPKGGSRPLLGIHPRDQDPAAFGFFHMFGLTGDSRYLVPGAPLYHAAPLRFAMATTRMGGTNVVMERFDPEQALATIERHGVTQSQWVPTMFVRMLRLPEDVRSTYDLSTHQDAVHSAAPCPIPVKEAMIEWWGPILHEYYAASEGGGLTYLSSPEWLAHRGSVGRALGCTLHILDEDGEELPSGEVGVVYAESGRPVAYLNDPEKTKAAHSRQGWVTVGDMGFLDEDGYLFLTDRKDHMIISGGVNIYPQESENVLIGHPKVADVAVIGVPNEEFGEEVKAVVELVDPAEASDELAEELLVYCREHLASYKCPRSVDFEPSLPRAPSGKLYKRKVRERYWAGTRSLVVSE